MKHWEELLAWVLAKHEDRSLDVRAHVIDASWDGDGNIEPDWDFTITAGTRRLFSHNDPNAAGARTFEAYGSTLDEAAEAVLAFMAEWPEEAS